MAATAPATFGGQGIVAGRTGRRPARSVAQQAVDFRNAVNVVPLGIVVLHPVKVPPGQHGSRRPRLQVGRVGGVDNRNPGAIAEILDGFRIVGVTTDTVGIGQGGLHPDRGVDDTESILTVMHGVAVDAGATDPGPGHRGRTEKQQRHQSQSPQPPKPGGPEVKPSVLSHFSPCFVACPDRTLPVGSFGR